jgi:hypothetical protein
MKDVLHNLDARCVVQTYSQLNQVPKSSIISLLMKQQRQDTDIDTTNSFQLTITS